MTLPEPWAPARRPTGPRSTAPATAFPALNPCLSPVTCVERHFGQVTGGGAPWFV